MEYLDHAAVAVVAIFLIKEVFAYLKSRNQKEGGRQGKLDIAEIKTDITKAQENIKALEVLTENHISHIRSDMERIRNHVEKIDNKIDKLCDRIIDKKI